MEDNVETIDRKFKFLAVNPGNGNIFTNYQGIVFLAKDNALLPTLEFYYQQCRILGVAKPQLDGIDLLIKRVKKWREANPDRCKIPDVDSGKEEAIVLAPNK